MRDGQVYALDTFFEEQFKADASQIIATANGFMSIHAAHRLWRE